MPMVISDEDGHLDDYDRHSCDTPILTVGAGWDISFLLFMSEQHIS
jgi:hypothetical protein